jgi:flagellar basal-body rod modification protein FlgD
LHGTGTSSVSGALDSDEIASNFTMFLQLLTTQLKNQNPLDPLDTNQFTQQLVQFAQVEQQMKSNDLLSGLVLLEKSSEATAALAYVGSTVVVDGSTARLPMARRSGP